MYCFYPIGIHLNKKLLMKKIYEFMDPQRLPFCEVIFETIFLLNYVQMANETILTIKLLFCLQKHFFSHGLTNKHSPLIVLC
jgi:hypothetical protein